MMKKNGYTFIELLVVITIMVLLGAGILLQQNLTKEDNVLKGAALDLQSFIRLAQSNATTSVLCEGVGSSSWTIEPGRTGGMNQVDFVDLKCYNPNVNPGKLQTTHTFDKTIQIDSIKGNFTGSCNTNAPTQTLVIRFPTLSAKPSFESPSHNSCVLASTNLEISLKNSKTNKTIIVIIDKGGSVDVK